MRPTVYIYLTCPHCSVSMQYRKSTDGRNKYNLRKHNRNGKMCPGSGMTVTFIEKFKTEYVNLNPDGSFSTVVSIPGTKR